MNQVSRIFGSASVLIYLIFATACLADDGALVIVGGGGVPDVVKQKFVELAGGPQAIIVVLPQASRRPDRGDGSIEMFKKLGVKQIAKVELTDSQQAQKQISEATGIWFSGGDQSRLMSDLRESKMIELIHERHRAGVAIGGTSAGAAVMSREMIIDTPKKPGLVSGNTPMGNGIGLVPEIIVDQHFVKRGRLARLLSAVLDQSKLLGVGIDEQTAIIVNGEKFEVLGRGSVVVMDGRNSNIENRKSGQRQNGSDLQLHVLSDGQTFQFREGLRD